MRTTILIFPKLSILAMVLYNNIALDACRATIERQQEGSHWDLILHEP